MPTPIIERIRVRPTPDESALLAAAIETPAVGAIVDGFALTISGWAVGRNQAVTGIKLSQPHEPMAGATVDRERPELAARFPEQPWAERAGFELTVDTVKLDPEFKLRLRADLADGSSASLATIRGRRRTRSDDYEPRFQPLLVTSLGRTGSTWLMRLLAEHPGVTTYRQYPYEVRPAKYWLHLFRVLTARPNPAKIVGQPNEFHLETLAAGSNPYRAPAFEALPALEKWDATDYAARLAVFCQQSIDEWYGIAAAAQHEESAVYFAEKQFPDETPRLAWGLYSGAREVVLVRDFRDMAASMLAYNAQRGFDDFGRVKRGSDDEWLTSLAQNVDQLAAVWHRRADRAHLVRYEDLIAGPAATMRAVFAYLGLDASDPTIEAIIARAAADPSELKKHQTTRDPAASIGRWRHDLPPDLRATANEVFHHALTTFGYDTNG